MDTDGSSLDEELAGLAPLLLEAMNAEYGDSLLLVGRVLGDHRDGTVAVAVGLDAAGLDLDLTHPTGVQRVRIDFERPLGSLDDLNPTAFAVVRRARALSGEEGETSAERVAREVAGIRTFVTRVSAVVDVHPHLRRITFAGDDLTAFSPLGPDTFLYVLLPPPGHEELTVDATFSWESWSEMPDDLRPVGAYYTLRHWRPETVELDMLFVLHDPAGPASEWAARARPGDPVALWGPRETFSPPADAAWYLLVADDTGLPALAAIVESLPPGTPVVVVAEVDGPDEHQPVPARDGVVVHWIHRAGRAPGTDVESLVRVVRDLQLPDGPGYVWGGGESRAVTAVRRHVRDTLGLSRERVCLVAYWRHADAVDHDDEEDEAG